MQSAGSIIVYLCQYLTDKLVKNSMNWPLLTKILNPALMYILEFWQIMQNTQKKQHLQNILYMQYQPCLAEHTKPNLPNQINEAYQAYWTRPTKLKLLVKRVNTWVHSAFGHAFSRNFVTLVQRFWSKDENTISPEHHALY